ncbi:Emc6 [Kluyveromyces lactis]|nr:Emc6 [Kluyveromyces lactis]
MSYRFTDLKSSKSGSFNNNKLLRIHDSTMLTAGLSAGILQLQSFAGFGMFFAVYTLVNLIFIAWFCKLKPSLYFTNPVHKIWVKNLFRELAGFVMTWTLAFTLVR